MIPLYQAGETITIEYEDDAVDFSGSTCTIELERYLGPLRLPAAQSTVHDGLITKESARAYHRTNELEAGFYRYRFQVEVGDSVAIVEGRFNVA